MTELPNEYLQYSKRREGMDHDHYDWSLLVDRPKVTWPEGKKLAISLTMNLEFFPLNQKGQPFKVPGGMTMPYPDLRHFSLREYGNRVGVYRVLDAFGKHGLKPSIAINGQLAQRDPFLCQEIRQLNCEVIGHGWNMDSLHYGGMEPSVETDYIGKTKAILSDCFNTEIKGWLSPAKNQSENTPDHLSSAGFTYMMDWVNDDMPYTFKTKSDPIMAFPLSTELEDKFLLMQNLQSESLWKEQILSAGEYLKEEAEEQGGRLLSLNIHPWLMGQAHRIRYLQDLLATLSSWDDVWFASPSEILESFSKSS